MEDSIKKIIKGCNNNNYSRAEEEDFSDEFGKTRVYKVQGEDQSLYYWNSSNSKNIQHSEALSRIADEILDDNESGSIDDGWNEIMFEIKA